VRNLIRSYHKGDHKITKFPSGFTDTDVRQDLMQEGYLAYYQLLKVNPKMATNPRYAKRCILNHLLQKEFKDKNKRNVTDNIVDEGHLDEDQGRDPLTSIDASLDLQTLIEAVDLSDAERLVLEYLHGFGRVQVPLSIAKTAKMMDRDREWVRSRYRAARIKLSVAASRY
jgi:DNA-directed RNA polymerase specialized sigma24 family protein